MVTPEAARNISFVGHTDQGGRGDGVQVMVNRGHAYIGTRVSRGVMVTDVRDPRHPKPVNFLPIHPNSWCMHVQTANDLLLCIEELDLKALLSQQDYYAGRTRSIPRGMASAAWISPPGCGSMISPIRSVRDRSGLWRWRGWGCIGSGGRAAGMLMPRRCWTASSTIF